MAVVRKFEFDNSFDTRPRSAAPTPVEPEVAPEPEAEPEPPAPTFSQGELDAARATAWIEGKMAGETEVRGSLTRRTAEAVEQLSLSLAEAAASQKRAIAAVETQAAETLLVLLRKLVPSLLKRSGTEEIELLLHETFAKTLGEPRLIVRCPPPLVAEVGLLANEAAAHAGFDGRTSVIGDSALKEQDCRIEWAEGGVEHSPRRMMELVEASIARALAAIDAPQAGAETMERPMLDDRRRMASVEENVA